MEATDISGVEQTHLMVAAQVHDPLLEESATDRVPYFDSYSGPKLLYELRFLIARQCSDAALHALDPWGTRDLARDMKDFIYYCRKGEEEEQEGDEEGITEGEEKEEGDEEGITVGEEEEHERDEELGYRQSFLVNGTRLLFKQISPPKLTATVRCVSCIFISPCSWSCQFRCFTCLI
jgi:hypothetical protein